MSIKLLQKERGREKEGTKEGRTEKCQHQNVQKVSAAWKKKNRVTRGEHSLFHGGTVS